jgi:hypothetical protein
MRRCLACALLLLFTALPARAQSARDQLRNLFHFGSCDTLVCLNVGTASTAHGTHYNPDAATSLTTLINFLGAGIETSVSNVPLGGTSSGITITFDQNGLPVATQGSMGSVFGERSQMLGRGRALFGVSVTSGSFTKLRGVSLTSLNTTLVHEDEAPTDDLGDPQYEFDTLHVTTSLHASVTTYTTFLTYGLSNRVDVGVAIPVVHFSFDGRSIGTVYNVFGGPLHYFSQDSLGNLQFTDTTRSSASVTGIGDIALRVKVNLTQTPRGGTALLTDIRLPTGRKDDLLGTGHLDVRALAIASGRFGAFSPHINAGYYFRGGDENSAALGTVGFDALVAPRFTVAADLIGEWQMGDSKIPLPPAARFADGSMVRRTTLPDMRDDVLGGSFGAKLGIGSVLTAVANVIVPFTNGGLRSSAIWTVGGELNYGMKFTK